MERNGWFFRLFFLVFACISTTAIQLLSPSAETFSMALLKGLGVASAMFGILLVLEKALKNLSLRAFNTAIIGLIFGSVVGFVITQSLNILLNFAGMSGQLPLFVSVFCYLTSIYAGIIVTSNCQDSWWLSIPFVRLAPATQTKKKEILLEISSLDDPRLLELARSGLLDHQLVVPTFIVKEIQKAAESQDESIRLRGRRCYEHFKRLEAFEHLGLQIKEFHFPEQEELSSKLSRAAKLLQAYILVSHELSQIRPEEDTPTTISLEAIAASLKPGAQRGEILSIKIQRLGKEPKQGVGYLEDSTMVVVNGGGEFLGQTIRTQVLSQKYSSSGKIVFCNALTQDEKGNFKPNGNLQEGTPYHLSYQ